ncbi:MAG: M20/M25/M40 family metallo-hydrolase [Clostridia bacterium]|nr:M20/M25/M40 family metallo-hydrolase [Clostridia bacterium]
MKITKGKVAACAAAAGFAVNCIRAARLKPSVKDRADYPDENVDLEKFERDLSDAIKIRTIANNDPSLTEWDEFERLHDLMRERFPLMFSRLEVRTFVRASLMFYWKGRNPSLDPMCLIGHQDVVPVSKGTLDDWTHPPFDGVNDGEFIWGRGALDMKNHTIGVCEAVEALLEEGFEPERDVYVCFGHNEEIMTRADEEGAVVMANWFRDQGIHLDSIIDEGGALLPVNVPGLLSCKLAGVGIAEKGYADFDIIATAKGGHSSAPPDHSAVGRLAKAITRIEAHQFKAQFTPLVNELFNRVGSNMTFPGRFVVADLPFLKPLVTAIMTKIPPAASMVRTTTAVTMTSGSPQANVLPQKAVATANFRIMPGQTVADVEKHLKKVIRDPGIEVVSLAEKNKEPSKISPSDSDAFRAIERICMGMNSDAVVAPYLVMGGTDACRYEEVCDNIYRYSPFLVDTSLLLTTHGTNERCPISALADGVAFFKRYIRDVSRAERSSAAL